MTAPPKPVTLPGSSWLHETTARWRAEAADQAKQAKRAAALPPRLVSTTIDLLHNKGRLDPDRTMSGILHSTAQRYYADWFQGGLVGISAINYDRIGGDHDKLPMTERQEYHRQQFRRARDFLGDKYSPIVDAVVLDEQPITAVRHMTGYKDKNAASAVATERLNTGLRRLAVNYGMLRP